MFVSTSVCQATLQVGSVHFARHISQTSEPNTQVSQLADDELKRKVFMTTTKSDKHSNTIKNKSRRAQIHGVRARVCASVYACECVYVVCVCGGGGACIFEVEGRELWVED